MKKVLVLMTLLVLMSVSAVLTTAKDCNDPDMICGEGDVDQTATIDSGSGDPPVIYYGWVLPDEDSYESGTNLYPALSDQRNDIYACVVAGDPQGRDDINNIYVDVFHPDGTGDLLPCVPSANNKCDYTGDPFDRETLFKYQVHATRLDPSDPVDMAVIEDCKTDALSAGLITQSDYNLINYNIFSQPEWYMYLVYLPMLYHQPSGWYPIEAWGTDTSSGVSDVLVNQFEWISTVAMEIDFFDGLNYGVLQPGVYKVIQGDYDMVDGDGQPTVKNEGNERIQIAVQSTVLTGDAHGKDIDDFDVKWDPMEIGGGHGHDYFGPDYQLTLIDPMELCQTEKIDFSAHADQGLPSDVYHGTLEIWTSAYDV